MCFILMYSVLNILSQYTYFYISKNITSYTFLLVSNIVESLQWILNEFFSKKCTPVANDSTLPQLLETPNETLSSLEIIANDIGNIIKALNVNKAHGHDEISIRMLKLCESAICEPLYLIF